MVNKRGRKRVNELYFGPNEEEAVVKFLVSENEYERNIIFNESLKKPLDKMIESIIRKYKLFRKSETFEELHSDTVSFLITKIHKFKPGLGKKAYSYFGTISKRYIIGLLMKDEKYLKQMSSYEDISSHIEERDDLTYEIDVENIVMDEFMKKLIIGIKKEIDTDNVIKKKLNDNELKVGFALIEILENWEQLFDGDGGPKYNKNTILETMRNYTNLSTKDIRIAMKKYKVLYQFLKQDGIE